MQRIHLIILLIFALTSKTLAQEFCFSQYYLDKLSISPAFAALGDYSEIGVIVRNQWPKIENGYKVFSAEYQQKLPSISSGIAVRISGSTSGGAYKELRPSAIYAYGFSLSQKWKCSLGMELSYLSRSLDQSKLVYYSMIDPATGEISALNDVVEKSGYGNLNFSAGGLVYSKKTVFALGVYRLTSFDVIKNGSTAPLLLTGLVNHKIVLAKRAEKNKIKESFLVPSICFSHSQISDIIMPGIYFYSKRLSGSLAYRFQKSDSITNTLITGIGFNFGQIELGFGFDFYLGAFQSAVKSASEAGIKYKFENSEKNKGSKTILCPAF
ncbi:MAG: PorP/SprF family type IX secretion system membrane protein [Bacteroidales bacterium]|nr:PorP/SprF family type IX secretion system membrane protein [Bacteroidales bacterium]